MNKELENGTKPLFLSQKWSEMGIKDKCAIGTAIAAFILGWGLTIAGFIVPPLGIVSDGVLFVLGQGLVYSASVFGIVGYFNASSMKMKKDLSEFMHSEIEDYERRRQYGEQQEYDGRDL